MWIGSYMLTRRGQPRWNPRARSATFNFKAVGGDICGRPWDISDPIIVKDAELGVFDQDRGLCIVDQGKDEGG